MKKVLVVVDMQNDFITGSLANKDAEAIIPNIIKELESKEYSHICFTKDTHYEDYLKTAEGKALPVKHCILGTEGYAIDSRLMEVNFGALVSYYGKKTFGSVGLYPHLIGQNDLDKIDEIVLCGTCTDICVVSNALILKAMAPETKITVLSNCCAGVTPEKHEAALEVMRSCQINVV